MAPLFFPNPLNHKPEMFRRYFILSSLALALTATLSGQLAAQKPAIVYIVHGIPGADLGLDPALPVDITVDGNCALTGVPFGAITHGLPFDEGSYLIEIRPADPVNPCSQPPLIAGTFDFTRGESASIVAHLDLNGGPTASKFTNDVRFSGYYGGRAIVHHVANAPTVDIKLTNTSLGGEKLIPGASNGVQASANVRLGLYNVEIIEPVTQTVVLGPVLQPIKPTRAYLIFAVGSLTNNTFNLLVTNIPLRQ